MFRIIQIWVKTFWMTTLVNTPVQGCRSQNQSCCNLNKPHWSTLISVQIAVLLLLESESTAWKLLEGPCSWEVPHFEMKPAICPICVFGSEQAFRNQWSGSESGSGAGEHSLWASEVLRYQMVWRNVCCWWKVRGASAVLGDSTPRTLIRSERRLWEDGWAVGALRKVFSIWLHIFKKWLNEQSDNSRIFQCYSITKKPNKTTKTLEIYLDSETDIVLAGSGNFRRFKGKADFIHVLFANIQRLYVVCETSATLLTDLSSHLHREAAETASRSSTKPKACLAMWTK